MMHPSKLRPIVLAVLAATLSLQAEAALDEVQVRMLRPYALPLRWDNVERQPQWVGGAQPGYRRDLGLHSVRLAPGESIVVRVARGEQVRVRHTDDMLAETDLEMDFSLGSGLYQQLPAALSADKHDMLSRMQATAPYLARISRPRASRSALELAVFISRHEPLGELAPYREVIALPGATVQVRRDDQGAPQDYWKFTPRQPVEVRIKGPARYALEHRYVYPANESSLLQTYRVHARLDGHPLAALEFETSAETAYPVYVDHQARVMGRSETGYLEIPPGDHMLSLDSTAPLMARLLQEQQDYLFPELNQPMRTALQVREAEEPFRLALSGRVSTPAPQTELPAQGNLQTSVPLQPRLSTWLAQPAELVRVIQDRTLTPTEKETAALRMVRDNARREGGLLGAALMQDGAPQHQDYPAVQTVVNELFGYHTFYRDLLPQENRTVAGQYFARFIPRDLHLLGEQGRGITQGEQHLQALLDHIPAAYFTRVPVHAGSNPIEVQPDGDNLKLILPADVLFDTDKWALKARYQTLLEETAALIQTRRPQRVRVIGYTDSRASESYNQQLSERRAQAVAGFLVRQGITPAILHAEGKGELQQRASNDSASGRQSNRRVEILLEGINKAEVAQPVKPGYHRYLVPTRVEPSLLRVIVDAPLAAEAEFFLQFDDAEPMRMRAVAARELPDSEYAPAQGDAALEMLANQFGRQSVATTDGPYAARRPPGRLLRPRLMEIPLPSHVHEIRAWQSGEGGQALNLALQYRAAKPFVLSESEYLEMAARTGDSMQTKEAFSRTLQSAVADEIQINAQELGNHWLPLVRALRSEHKIFTAPVVAMPAPSGKLLLKSVQLERLHADAQMAAREGKWLPALEAWGEVVRNAPLPLREEAELAQCEALLQLGEDYLAEQQLRSLALHAADKNIAQHAVERLDAYYRASGEQASLVSLWATMSVRAASNQNLRRLVEAFIDNSEYEQALALGLLLPQEEQPREHLMRAAYQLGWWAEYQRLAESMPGVEQQNFWQGLSDMSRGRIEDARQRFETGGQQGQIWLAALDSGRTLMQKLQQPRLEPADMEAWQRWYSNHPGPFAWREEAHLVNDFAGSETLYSIDRDAYSRAYLATADKPVRLKLMGPVRLRIEARPVHAASATQPLDGWLRLKDADGVRLLPISNNLPAPGLELAGHSDSAPGRKVNGDFDFGPGLHEVALDAGNLPVLLRVFARRPEMAIPLVPALQVERMQYAQGSATASEEAATCWWKNGAVLVSPGEEDHTYSRDLQLGLLLEHGGQSLAPLQTDPPACALPPAGERLPGMAWPEAAKLAEGDIEAALALHQGQDEVDALRRMTLLLWRSEQNPAMHERALVEAEALAARYPLNAVLQSMQSRLSRDALWQPATGIQDSAGQRYVEVSGWQPESPALRTRKALMRDIGATDQMVSGNGQVLFTLRNLHPSSVELHLAQDDVAALSPVPLNAFYQLDNAAPVSVILSPGKPMHIVRLNIQGGDHTLRAGIASPLANQFLRVNLAERGPAVPMNVIERPWHVATRQEPLRLAVAGPAWLRVDELRNGKVESRYQWISGDFEELSLAPSDKRPEALFRVHQRVLVPGSTPILPRVTEVTPEPVPPPFARIETVEPARRVAIKDGFRLGGQEDGTWSYSAQLARRRDPQSANTQPEDLMQLGAAWRFYDEDQRTYLRTEILGRLRDSGGPTLALLESIEHRPVWTTLNFILDAGAYFQRPESSNQWSAFLKGAVMQRRDIDPKTYHVPRIALFAREFSMNSIAGYAPEKVDQDIFTGYKFTHRHGLEIGDTLYHRPWLDTMWHASTTIVSNENFDISRPDHFSFKTGWQQLLGKFQVAVNYQLNHYFADDLRSTASNQRTWLLDANLNHWNKRQNRFEAGVQLRHDSDTGDITGMLIFTWHDSNGRRYRDFRPGEVDFIDLRTRDIPPAPNNVVKEIKND